MIKNGKNNYSVIVHLRSCFVPMLVNFYYLSYAIRYAEDKFKSYDVTKIFLCDIETGRVIRTWSR